MGHLPIEDTLARVPPGTRLLYTHLNNTNPVARPGAPELASLAAAGAEVAADGMVVEV
jgi:pyrroloquinoline quinone biosynthesis protein B